MLSFDDTGVHTSTAWGIFGNFDDREQPRG
jgi:hypothetical protein